MLIESVPNVSEGRRLDVVDRLAEAIESVPGVYLLDRTSDASHNRSVFTMAGEHGAGDRGARAAGRRRRSTRSTWTRTAASTRASGPWTSSRSCPLGDDDDGRLRRARPGVRRSGIATRFDLPVYLYAHAALRPDRVKLADVRRGQYEGLKAEIDQRGREPDFGPARMHPSAGAVAVGARPFLIAYNINLDVARTSSSPSGSPGASASRAAACRRSRPTASGSRSCAAPRSR